MDASCGVIGLRHIKEDIDMDKFIPKDKLSKRARKALHLRNRATWEGVNPATRRMESKKLYNRKKTRIMEKNQYPGFDFTGGFRCIRPSCIKIFI